MQAHVGFNELDGRAGRGILLIGLSRLHGKAILDGLKVWLKIDAIQRKIEEAAKASRIAGRHKNTASQVEKTSVTNRANTNQKNRIF